MRTQALVNVAGLGLAFGSITGSYQNISPLVSGRGVILHVENSLDTISIISLDAGVTDWVFLPPGKSMQIPFGSCGVEWTGRCMVKHNGIPPTAGFISAAIVRAG